MRISDLLKEKERFISLEYFPPKDRKDWPSFFNVVKKLKAIDPLFVSMTYGAGGGTQENTLELVTRLKKEFDLEPMAHLTCVGASEQRLNRFLESLVKEKIENVLALGGDTPKEDENYIPESDEFKYASDLVTFIRARYQELGIGVAGYPEKHPRAESMEEDIRFLKFKLDRGGDFVITQLFFENDFYWSYVRKTREAGIDKPIIPGVMPIFNLKLIKKIVSMCGAKIPDEFLKELESADKRGGAKAVESVGIEYARAQALDLLDKGAPGVHLYTLNKAEGCLKICDGLR